MEVAWVLRVLKANQSGLLTKRRLREPFYDGLAPTVRLDNDVDAGNASQVSCPRLVPGCRSRDADGRDAVEPKRVTVRFPLDQHGIASAASSAQPPQAIQGGSITL